VVDQLVDQHPVAGEQGVLLEDEGIRYTWTTNALMSSITTIAATTTIISWRQDFFRRPAGCRSESGTGASGIVASGSVTGAAATAGSR
jgi:hypothetical protein